MTHSTSPSVIDNSTCCSLGFCELKSLSNIVFISFDFPRFCPFSSLIHAMSDISLLRLSVFLQKKSLYIIFYSSLASSVVYTLSYAFSFAIATALLAVLLASLYAYCSSSLFSFLVCFERILFGCGSTSGVYFPP